MNSVRDSFDNKWIAFLGYLLLTESFLLALFYTNPIFLILSICSIFLVYFFYKFFITSLYLWVIILIASTALDQWGRVINGITVFHIAWFLSILSLLIAVLYKHKFTVIIKTPINKYVFFYISFSFFTLIFSPNVESGLQYLATTLALFLFFLVLLNVIKSIKHYKIIIYSFIGSNLFLSMLALYQLLFQNILYFGRYSTETSTGEKIWRVSATFDDPNVAATFMFVGILFTLGVIIYSREKLVLKILLVISLIPSIAGIIATFSRSGWVSLIAGIIVLVLFQKNKKYILYTLIVSIIIFGAFLIYTPYGEFITSRFESIFEIMSDVSIRTRVFMAVSGIWMFLDNPIFGIGYRGFPVLYDYYIHPETPRVLLHMKESHTLFITLLAETGLIGVSIVFLWFKRVFKDNISFIRKVRDPFLISILISSFATFVALNIDFLFYGSLFPHFNLIWLIFAIIYSVEKNFIDINST